MLATGALAGPAMAASDNPSAAALCRKAGEKPLEYLTGGDTTDGFNAFKAGGEPQRDIIAIL